MDKDHPPISCLAKSTSRDASTFFHNHARFCVLTISAFAEMNPKCLISEGGSQPEGYGSIVDPPAKLPHHAVASRTADATSFNNSSQRQKDGARRRGVILGFVGLFLSTILVMIVTECFSPTLSNHDSYSSLRLPKMGISTDFSDKDSQVPFPYIDRSNFGNNPVPATDIVDPNLFAPNLRGDNDGEKRLLKVPFPTGAYWTNLVIQPTADRGLSYPIMAYPYGYKWNSNMLQVSLPSLRRLMDSKSIRDIFNPDLTLTTIEDVEQRNVQCFDPLSVTLRFQSASLSKEEEAFWDAFIVQGSPYVTVRFQNVTPVLRALSTFKGISCLRNSKDENVCTSDSANGRVDQVPPKFIRLLGTQFVVQTRENLSWLLFTSEPVTLVFDNVAKTTITMDEKFSGVLRLALIPPPLKELTAYTNQFPQSFDSVFDSSGILTKPSLGVQKLINHANAYPIGAKVEWSFPFDNQAKINFRFNIKFMIPDRNKSELLMLALPHHVDAMSEQQKSSKDYQLLRTGNGEFDLVYKTIKGHMAPVIGSVWSYNENLTSIGFDDDAALDMASKLSNTTRKTILDQVTLDLRVVLPTLDENVYGYGKQLARLAQLVHISNVLLRSPSCDSSQPYYSIIQEAGATLFDFVTAYISGRTRDSLVFDMNFGGLVTKDGLDDFMNDFGNGWYNDHHFHYGYFLYSCALLGKWNSSFVSEYGSRVDAIMYDVAHRSHASSDDSSHGAFFPLARHKSWFDGHSFASGLFPFASGKSMESSSESINCYYGAYLWSMVRGQDDDSSDNQLEFARLLLATEIRAVKTYWHMDPNDNRLFNPIFAKNMMIGNLGMMDVTVSTWFGNNPLYVHMINFMPVTAITRELFNNRYLKNEYNDIIKPIYDGVEMAWKGYVVCDRAMLEPNQAWQDALKLRSYELDQALSQSQVLYFVCTIDGFVENSALDDSVNAVASAAPESLDGASVFCWAHQGCADLGLTGYCCPSTPGGINLGCCDGNRAPSTSNASNAAFCSANAGCANLGLVGSCCPPPSGPPLSCCG